MKHVPENNAEQTGYISYLLRLWQVDRQSNHWRVSLDDAHTGERKGFASLEDLIGYLYQQIGRHSEERQKQDEDKEVLTERGISGPKGNDNNQVSTDGSINN